MYYMYMKLAFSERLYFLNYTFFHSFFFPFWGTNKLFGIMVFVLTKWEILMAPWTTATKESFFVAVNHCNEGNSYVAVTHCNKGKCLLSQWSKATKGNYYVVVNQCANRKFLCRCEPPRWRKIPMLQWTTMTKKTYLLTQWSTAKKGKLICFEQNNQELPKTRSRLFLG